MLVTALQFLKLLLKALNQVFGELTLAVGLSRAEVHLCVTQIQM
jgi:hypothetical protein